MRRQIKLTTRRDLTVAISQRYRAADRIGAEIQSTQSAMTRAGSNQQLNENRPTAHTLRNLSSLRVAPGGGCSMCS